jgi:hypothetical protein
VADVFTPLTWQNTENDWRLRMFIHVFADDMRRAAVFGVRLDVAAGLR